MVAIYYLKKARVLVPRRPFQLSKMFGVTLPGAYPSLPAFRSRDKGPSPNPDLTNSKLGRFVVSKTSFVFCYFGIPIFSSICQI
jgi:hypothetical protein